MRRISSPGGAMNGRLTLCQTVVGPFRNAYGTTVPHLPIGVWGRVTVPFLPIHGLMGRTALIDRSPALPDLRRWPQQR